MGARHYDSTRPFLVTITPGGDTSKIWRNLSLNFPDGNKKSFEQAKMLNIRVVCLNIRTLHSFVDWSGQKTDYSTENKEGASLSDIN